MEGVEDFDTSCWGLMPVRVATVGGLVLVDLSGDAPDAGDHAGELAGHLERYRVDALAPRRPGRLRGRGELEGDRRELQRVPALPRRPPGAQRLSHYMSGEVLDGAGAWCGGSMTLTEGASTMGTRGGSRAAPPADRRPRRRATCATSSTSRSSRTRWSRCIPTTRCSTRCGRARPTAPTWSASGSSSPRRWRRPTSTPPTRSNSGTRSTARTGTSASSPQKGVRNARLLAGPLLGRGSRRARLRLDGRRPLHGCPARPRGRWPA